MRKNQKANITLESLSTLAEQAVQNAKARRATVLEDAELDQAVGGVARDAGLKPVGVKIGGGATMGMRDPDPDYDRTLTI